MLALIKFHAAWTMLSASGLDALQATWDIPIDRAISLHAPNRLTVCVMCDASTWKGHYSSFLPLCLWIDSAETGGVGSHLDFHNGTVGRNCNSHYLLNDVRVC